MGIICDYFRWQKKGMRPAFFRKLPRNISKNSRMASACRPHQKVALIGSGFMDARGGLGLIFGVQWARTDGKRCIFSIFPIKHNR